MQKTYIALRSVRLATSITVNENGRSYQKPITFDGGMVTPIKRNGRFTTTNEAVQKAIENDKRYGIDYIDITKKVNISKKKATNGKSVNAPSAPKTPEPTKVDEDPDTIRVGDEVKNITEAKNYLVGKFPEITPEQIANRDKTLETAKGKNIVFDSLK